MLVIRPLESTPGAVFNDRHIRGHTTEENYDIAPFAVCVECGASWTEAALYLPPKRRRSFSAGRSPAGRRAAAQGGAQGGGRPRPSEFCAVGGRERASGPTRRAKWAKKWFALRSLGAARSRQDESIEAGEVGSKRPSSGCIGVHVLSLYPLTWRSLFSAKAIRGLMARRRRRAVDTGPPHGPPGSVAGCYPPYDELARYSGDIYALTRDWGSSNAPLFERPIQSNPRTRVAN
jgi:hypothetical protein